MGSEMCIRDRSNSVFKKAVDYSFGVNNFYGEVLMRPVIANDPLRDYKGKTIAEGVVLQFAGVFKRLEKASNGKNEALGKYNELTLIGLLEVSLAKPSGPDPSHRCFEFSPVEKGKWSQYGLLEPIAEGTILRIFEDDASNYDFTDLSTTLKTAQDGYVFYEIGHIGNVEGEGSDARPETTNIARPDFRFMSNSTLRIGANLTMQPKFEGAGLLTLGHGSQFFGAPTQAKISADKWNWVKAIGIPGWRSAGDIKMSIRNIRE